MFESALSTQSRNPRRWAAFPAAVGLHLSALVVVVGADLWTVKPVTVHATNAVFVTFTPPPLPAAAPGPVGRPAPEPVRPEPVQREEIVQPPTTIEELPEPEIRPSTVTVVDLDAAGAASGSGSADGSEKGRDGGIDGGFDHGDPNSTSLLPGAGPVAPLVPAGPIRVTAKVKKPEIITRVDPVYTEAARRVKVQGAVILEAVIDERGNVTSVRVVKGLPMGLEQSAVDAVSRWKFQPATLDGRPVAVYFNLTVSFRVQ